MGKKEEKETITIEQLKDLFQAIRRLGSGAELLFLDNTVHYIVHGVVSELAKITGDDNDIKLARKLFVRHPVPGYPTPENIYRARILLHHAKIFKTPSAIRKAREAIQKIPYNNPLRILDLISLAEISRNRNDVLKAREAVLNLEDNRTRVELLINLAEISKNPNDLKVAKVAIDKMIDDYTQRQTFLSKLKEIENSAKQLTEQTQS
ncbi:MAG: hypothetical protein ACTSV6_08805 [Candidatus Heimdallarchaeota archaeon]